MMQQSKESQDHRSGGSSSQKPILAKSEMAQSASQDDTPWTDLGMRTTKPWELCRQIYQLFLSVAYCNSGAVLPAGL
jgi:hypothetical protein